MFIFKDISINDSVFISGVTRGLSHGVKTYLKGALWPPSVAQ